MQDTVPSTLHSTIILVLITIELGAFVISNLLNDLPKVAELGLKEPELKLRYLVTPEPIFNHYTRVLLKILGAEILFGPWL